MSQSLDKKMKYIIYPDETEISIIVPSGELSVEETALKIVPTGVKYKIVDASDLPEDQDFRSAWEFDFTTDFDGVGA
jgi:homogentisate 1,2-dioxygenase